ncbi:MAG: YbcC family protein [Ramlibacter sp.]
MDTLLTPPAPLAVALPSAQPAPVQPQPVAEEINGLIERACAQACRAIAPAWPLDRAIAVNPHWERVDRPVREVAARMAVLADVRVFAPRDMAREAWRAGRIAEADLTAALGRLPEARAVGLGTKQAVAALDETPALRRLPLLIDVLDDDPEGRHRLSWRQAITHQVSQVCAAYFDTHQADWQPDRDAGLYAFWRETLTHDHAIGVLMGLPDISRGLAALPATRVDAERWVLQRLGLPEESWADYLEAVLLTVNGWGSWCAYLGWEARLAGGVDSHLRDLLAIRLAWGAILLECRDDAAARRAFAALQVEWERAPELLEQAGQTLLVDEAWQLALEMGYQRELAQRLATVGAPHSRVGASAVRVPEVQAAFCIDVRSEPLRRAIESIWPAVQTIGFAGFFGLPVAYTPLATNARRPQLPGLLAPTAEVTERIAEGEGDFGAPGDALQLAARQQRLRAFARVDQWGAGSRWPNAAFSFVEAAGAGYLGKLAQWVRPSIAPRRSVDAAGLSARYRPVCRPLLAGLDTQAKVDLAQRVLHAMGLERGFAPLVLLVGHGSQSANNAQAAALDCGACCGQTGEVNARVLARLLNEPAVREGLNGRGIVVPQSTAFVAALHNTTTDEIEGFDLDLLDAQSGERWKRLQLELAHASDQVRRERAGSLGLDPRAPHEALLDQYRRRANDGAQTRPEWGLAGNAAFIMAPRDRSRGARLGGRVFLHDYSAGNDPDGSVLELLMTAPMLVTHWINWQYHASTCDPVRLGSGNKLLHNVVGGRIGVFEGNGGDLRIGLGRQSLHDGLRWVHEPLRLTVVIDAPAASIERVIAGHRVVRQLVDNGWLHLWRFEGDGFARYDGGGWRPTET